MFRDYLTANDTTSTPGNSNALRSIIIATIGSGALLAALSMTGGATAAAHAATEQERTHTAPCNEHLVSVRYLA